MRNKTTYIFKWYGPGKTYSYVIVDFQIYDAKICRVVAVSPRECLYGRELRVGLLDISDLEIPSRNKEQEEELTKRI